MLQLDEAGKKLFSRLDEAKNKSPGEGADENTYTDNVPQSEGAGEWENPILFEDYPVPSFPPVLPDWCNDYAQEFAERVQVPLDAPCMAILSVLSAALAKKYVVHLPQHDWTERINLYGATIMPPSEKKSETLRVFCAPLHRHEEKEIERVKPMFEQQKEERDAKSKRIEQLKGEYAKKGDKDKLHQIKQIREELDAEQISYVPQFVSTDCTPEKLVGLMQQNKERMAIITAEGGIFDIMAGRYSSGMMNLDIYLNSWSGDQTRVDRQNRSEYLKEPALTFGLFVQPDVIAKLPEAMVRRGLLGRFLYSVPQSKVGYRKLESANVDHRLRTQYSENMNWLLELNVSNHQLLLSSEAYVSFKAFWERVEVAQREGGELTGALQAWGGKLAGNMLRVAALVHVASYAEQRNIPSTITGDTMHKVVEIGEYFIQHAAAAFGYMGVDEPTEHARYLLKVIKNQESDMIPLQSLWQLTKKRMGSAETIRKAVTVLVDRGFCKLVKADRKEYVLVNPQVATPQIGRRSPFDRELGARLTGMARKQSEELGELGVHSRLTENDEAENEDVYV